MERVELALIRLGVAIVCLCLPIASETSPFKIDYTGGPTKLQPPGLPELPVPHRHVPSEDYLVGADNWRVWLVPDPPEYLRVVDAATAAIIAAELGVGWTFASSARELSDDSLVVRLYEATYETPCLNIPAEPECVGANFGLDYVPGVGDPAVIHWIQVVKSNHRPGALLHGVGEHRIDLTRPRTGLHRQRL